MPFLHWLLHRALSHALLMLHTLKVRLNLSFPAVNSLDVDTKLLSIFHDNERCCHLILKTEGMEHNTSIWLCMNHSSEPFGKEALLGILEDSGSHRYQVCSRCWEITVPKKTKFRLSILKVSCFFPTSDCIMGVWVCLRIAVTTHINCAGAREHTAPKETSSRLSTQKLIIVSS